MSKEITAGDRCRVSGFRGTDNTFLVPGHCHPTPDTWSLTPAFACILKKPYLRLEG